MKVSSEFHKSEILCSKRHFLQVFSNQNFLLTNDLYHNFLGCDVTLWLDLPLPLSHFVRFLTYYPPPLASNILFAWPRRDVKIFHLGAPKIFWCDGWMDGRTSRIVTRSYLSEARRDIQTFHFRVNKNIFSVTEGRADGQAEL